MQTLNNKETKGTIRGKINLNFQELVETKVSSTSVLVKTNTTPFSPTGDYHPAPKIYVDNAIVTLKVTYDPTGKNADAFNRENHYGEISPSEIALDEDNRFVSDLLISEWNQKENSIGTKGTAFNKSFGTIAGTIAEGNHLHTKADIGLSNVDNTSDINKALSTASVNALALKANLNNVYDKDSADLLLDAKRDSDNNVFGDFDAGNYSEFRPDGTLVFEGEASVWNDISSSLIGKRLFDNQGTVDYDYENNALLFSSDGLITNQDDRVGFSIQLPHGAILGAGQTLNFHLHWVQTDSTAREFTVRYRMQANGVATSTSWTTLIIDTSAVNVFPYVSGSLNQITPCGEIPLDTATISSIIEIQFTRSDSEAGTISAKFADYHYKSGKVGSADEYS